MGLSWLPGAWLQGALRCRAVEHDFHLVHSADLGRKIVKVFLCVLIFLNEREG